MVRGAVEWCLPPFYASAKARQQGMFGIEPPDDGRLYRRHSETSVTTTRILVIKHGALGDMVQGLDAFAGLRAGHLDAHIALLTTPPFAGLSRLMPWFDEVILDPRAPVVNLAQLWRMRQQFHVGWDMVIDLQCSRRTARYQQMLVPASCRWFGTAPGASDPYPDFTGVNNADRMKIGIGMAGGDASVTADLDWLNGGTGIVAEYGGATILVPGCSAAKPSKRWPAASFAALARAEMESGRRVVLVGTAADRTAADAVLAGAPGCVDLVSKTGLADLAALFRAAGGIVGNDTGPTFLAARCGAPTVMLMGADTDPSRSAPVGAKAGWIRSEAVSDVTAEAALARLDKLRSS